MHRVDERACSRRIVAEVAFRRECRRAGTERALEVAPRAVELVAVADRVSHIGGASRHEERRRVARILDIPFCVAGGIRTVADAEEVLGEGAEKVSINSPALADPDLISRLSKRFGAQCVVVGIDSQVAGDEYHVYQFTGDPNRTRNTARRTLDWVREVQDRGIMKWRHVGA